MEEGTNCCVFVASHLCYDRQISYLDECLTSLISQTVPVKVCVSVSFANEEEYRRRFTQEIFPKFMKSCTFSIHSGRMYQMEHLRHLTRRYLVSSSAPLIDWVLFCDDDDFYNEGRVETLLNFYTKSMAETTEAVTAANIKGVKECGSFEEQTTHETFPEFWANMLRPKLLVDFFNIMDQVDPVFLRNVFADMLFRHFISVYRKDECKASIALFVTPRLYHHRRHPESVCERERFICIAGCLAADMAHLSSPDVVSFLILRCTNALVPDEVFYQHYAHLSGLRRLLLVDTKRMATTGRLVRDMTWFLERYFDL